MTKFLKMLPRFVATRIRNSRRQVALRALTACLASGLLGGVASAQRLDDRNTPTIIERASGFEQPNFAIPANYQVAPDVIGSGIGPQSMPNAPGVMVGPGGPTALSQVPSNMAPVPTGPMVSGPYVQTPPLYGDKGYEIPCPCDAGCDFTWYGSAEALYFRREGDQSFSLTQGAKMSDFDYELGGRVTIGNLKNCVNAWEASFAGPFKWTRGSDYSIAPVQSRITPALPYTGLDISGFNNADRHIQSQTSELYSFEINRRRWAWDVISTFVGLRAINFRDAYTLTSITGGNTTGFLSEKTRNIMIGPQVGGDIRTNMGLRTLLGVKGKAGVLANFNRSETQFQNLVPTVNNLNNSSDDDVAFAGIVELGGFGVYSITESVRLTAGYEGWYMADVATVPNQGINVMYPDRGTTVVAKDGLFIHGGSAGIEILY